MGLIKKKFNVAPLNTIRLSALEVKLCNYLRNVIVGEAVLVAAQYTAASCSTLPLDSRANILASGWIYWR